jgi:hypothetical protein
MGFYFLGNDRQCNCYKKIKRQTLDCTGSFFYKHKKKFGDLIFSLTFAAAMTITKANTGFFYFSYYFRNSPGCLC